MKDKKIYNLVLNALFIALVFLATEFVQIRLPISINGGLVHLGTANFVRHCSEFWTEVRRCRRSLWYGNF